MTSNSTNDQVPNVPATQPMPIAHRSLSQSTPASPGGFSSNIPFLRKLFPAPVLQSTSVPNDNHMDHLSRHGPMAMSYRRHSIDVSSLRSMRAEAEQSSTTTLSSSFGEDSVDASSLSAKANGQQGPSRMLEGFCKYEWDFSG